MIGPAGLVVVGGTRRSGGHTNAVLHSGARTALLQQQYVTSYLGQRFGTVDVIVRNTPESSVLLFALCMGNVDFCIFFQG